LQVYVMRLRGLIIEDSAFMRLVLMNALKRVGGMVFEFDEAADGVEGLEKFAGEATDIIFVDWNMPRMTGIDFARRLRATPGGNRVPIIMITSHKAEAELNQALGERVVDAVVRKPFTVEVLEQQLHQALTRPELKAGKQQHAGAKNQESESNEPIAQTLVAACMEALESTLGSICGQPPTCRAIKPHTTPCGAMVAVISFFGPVPWSFSLVLPRTTAEALAARFAGWTINFDSPEMGDLVGELGNMVAGAAMVRLEKRGLSTNFSLPIVTRGLDVEILSRVGTPWHWIEVQCPQGQFWLKIANLEKGHILGPRPGT
jgi:CheY-like chemotaxis protein/CheY-specific phosphatase CheX